MAILTVLAMGKGSLPLTLTVSPVARSSAATPTSPGVEATSQFSCCSSERKLGEDTAHAGCAPKARSQQRIAMKRMPCPHLLPVTIAVSPALFRQACGCPTFGMLNADA